MPKRGGKKKDRYGRKKYYHDRRRRRRNRAALKSWKRGYPEWFVFEPDRYPFYFVKS